MFSIDNLLKYLIFILYIRSTKSLRKHLIPLNLEYFERTGVKIDQCKAALYSVCQKTISQRYSDSMLIFMSALLGPNELLSNLFVYTLVFALRKIFADSFGFACRQLLYYNLSKFEAPRARRYFRSCFTLATIVLLLLSYHLICLGYWDLLISYLTPLEIT